MFFCPFSEVASSVGEFKQALRALPGPGCVSLGRSQVCQPHFDGLGREAGAELGQEPPHSWQRQIFRNFRLSCTMEGGTVHRLKDNFTNFFNNILSFFMIDPDQLVYLTCIYAVIFNKT
jgi:hypothetical protein